jgi:hypothetical protein
MADCLEALGRTEQALPADREAVASLSAHFQAHPQAFGSVMASIFRDYLRRCESAGQDPDADLVMPIVEVFQARSEHETQNDEAQDEPRRNE